MEKEKKELRHIMLVSSDKDLRNLLSKLIRAFVEGTNIIEVDHAKAAKVVSTAMPDGVVICEYSGRGKGKMGWNIGRSTYHSLKNKAPLMKMIKIGSNPNEENDPDYLSLPIGLIEFIQRIQEI